MYYLFIGDVILNTIIECMKDEFTATKVEL